MQWNDFRLTIDFIGGTPIHEAVPQAIALAAKLDCIVLFKFNGTEVWVRGFDDAQKKIDEWGLDQRREGCKPGGPKCYCPCHNDTHA